MPEQEIEREKSVTFDWLMRRDAVSLHTLYAKAGLVYADEMKFKKDEIKDLKEIAHSLQSPYEKE